MGSQIMSDIIESIVGAIFVSDGFDIKPLRAVFEKLFEPFYNKYIRLQTLSPHPTTTLMELLQAEHCHAHGMRKKAQGGSVRYDGRLRAVNSSLTQSTHVPYSHSRNTQHRAGER